MSLLRLLSNVPNGRCPAFLAAWASTPTSPGSEPYAGRTTLLIASQQDCSPTAAPCAGYFRTALPVAGQDFSEKTAILVRVGEVVPFDPPPPPIAGTSFDLGLESVSGEVSWCNASRVGGVPRPYHRGDRADRYMLKTLRFSISCFVGEDGAFLERNRGNIAAIRLRPQAETGRQIAFDDLQLE